MLARTLVMHYIHTIPLWHKNPCKSSYDKWGRQILAEKHEYREIDQEKSLQMVLEVGGDGEGCVAINYCCGVNFVH